MSTTIATSGALSKMNALSRIRRSRLSRSTQKGTEKVQLNWPCPQTSVGRCIATLGKKTCWEAIGPARSMFDILAPEIKTHLDTYSEPTSEWVSWSIYMVGLSPGDAVPTIVFCCESERHRKSIRDMIRDSGILDAYPGIALKHLSRAPDCKQPLVQLASPSGTVTVDSFRKEEDSTCYEVFSNLDQPVLGSLLFVTNSKTNNAFRKATCGGMIYINGSRYLMTAGHVFSSQPQTSSKRFDDLDELAFSDSDDDWDTSSSNSVRSAFSILDSQGSAVILSDSLSLPDGYKSIGELAFSSIDGSFPELDYALVRLHGEGAASPSENDTTSHDPQRKDACNGLPIEAVAYTASGGPVRGIIAPGTAFVRAPNALKYQEVYHVTLEKPLANGDCGSWVYDSQKKKLYGHIVAGSPETGLAFVVPAYQTFEDIDRLPDLSQRRPAQEKESDDSRVNEVLDDSQAKINHSDAGASSKQVQHDPEAGTTQSEQLDAAPVKSPCENMSPVDDPRVSFERGIAIKFQALMKQTQWEALKDLRDYLVSDRLPPSRERHFSFPIVPRARTSPETGASRFQKLFHHLSEMPLKWEVPQALDQALQCIPLEAIYGEADRETGSVDDTTRSSISKPPWGYQDYVIQALSRWFRRSFFTWVNNPPCEACLGSTKAIGLSAPTAEEQSLGAKQVEIYTCMSETSHELVRFPRYSDPSTLLSTRRGRVGEWANAFGLLCRALGSRVRWVWNAEDHVWIEIYSEHQKRWVHVDCCEEAWDRPNLYTEDWGRKLSYCIAFSTEGATDVTSRYVRRRKFMSPRTQCSEAELLYVLDDITTLRLRTKSKEERARLEAERKREAAEMLDGFVAVLVQDLCKNVDATGNLPSDSLPAASESRKAREERTRASRDVQWQVEH